MIIKFFQKIRFILINADLCILVYKQGDALIFVKVYIINLVFESKSQDRLDWLDDQLIKMFNMKDIREVKTIIR